MAHRITETQYPGAQPIMIATTDNYAHAYGIAQAMSEKYHDFTYAAINGNVERVIQYKGGRVISDVIEGVEHERHTHTKSMAEKIQDTEDLERDLIDASAYLKARGGEGA